MYNAASARPSPYSLAADRSRRRLARRRVLLWVQPPIPTLPARRIAIQPVRPSLELARLVDDPDLASKLEANYSRRTKTRQTREICRWLDYFNSFTP